MWCGRIICVYFWVGWALFIEEPIQLGHREVVVEKEKGCRTQFPSFLRLRKASSASGYVSIQTLNSRQQKQKLTPILPLIGEV